MLDYTVNAEYPFVCHRVGEVFQAALQTCVSNQYRTLCDSFTSKPLREPIQIYIQCLMFPLQIQLNINDKTRLDTSYRYECYRWFSSFPS